MEKIDIVEEAAYSSAEESREPTDFVVTKKSSADKNIISKEVEKMLTSEINSHINIATQKFQQELAASIKTILNTYGQNVRSKQKKSGSIMRKEPVNISMSKVHPAFKEAFLNNIKKNEVNLSHIQSTLLTTCFDDKILINETPIHNALNLSDIEKKILKSLKPDQTDFFVTTDDKNILMKKIISMNTIIKIDDIEYDVASDKIIVELTKAGLISERDDDFLSIDNKILAAMQVTFDKKIPLDPLKCSRNKLQDVFKNITKKSTSIYCAINDDFTATLDHFQIPYIKIGNVRYTKIALVKDVFSKRFEGKPGRLSQEDVAYFSSNFPQWQFDKINLDKIISMIKMPSL